MITYDDAMHKATPWDKSRMEELPGSESGMENVKTARVSIAYVKGSYDIPGIGDRHRRPQHDGAVAVNLLTPSVFDSPN